MAQTDPLRKRSAFALLGQIKVWRLEHGRPMDEPGYPRSSRVPIGQIRIPGIVQIVFSKRSIFIGSFTNGRTSLGVMYVLLGLENAKWLRSHSISLIKTMSLFVVPRTMNNRDPSTDQLKLEMSSEVNCVSCFGLPPLSGSSQMWVAPYADNKYSNVH